MLQFYACACLYIQVLEWRDITIAWETICHLFDMIELSRMNGMSCRLLRITTTIRLIQTDSSWLDCTKSRACWHLRDKNIWVRSRCVFDVLCWVWFVSYFEIVMMLGTNYEILSVFCWFTESQVPIMLNFVLLFLRQCHVHPTDYAKVDLASFSSVPASCLLIRRTAFCLWRYSCFRYWTATSWRRDKSTQIQSDFSFGSSRREFCRIKWWDKEKYIVLFLG